MSGLVPVPEGKDFSFPKEEEAILAWWNSVGAFKEQLARGKAAGKPSYVFYDGPPFATGLPHYGHILAGTIKDIVTRYASANGFYCERRFGWDCHGLPVEYEIDKKLDIKSKDDVLAMGIDKYNEECRAIVMRYSKEWERTVTRMGRWIDFENDYKTLDPTFMESVWWVFKRLYDQGLVYRGHKVMPFSTTCNTPLSNFEAGLNYKDVQDPAVWVSFPLVDDPDNAEMVAWTTTPWTLPSNLALCVHPEFTYVKVKDPESGRCYIVAEARLSELPGAVPKKPGKKDKNKAPTPGFTVTEKMDGASLLGKRYKPLFDFFKGWENSEEFWRICADKYVTDDSGTGVVHQAPAYGEDDYRVCMAHGIIKKGGDLPNPVDDNGRFIDPVTQYAKQYIKDADKLIIKDLKKVGRVVHDSSLQHSYPFCWRSDTPLIYRCVPSWFVQVESLRERLLANNNATYWVPTMVKEKRFHNWLESAHDWAISRSRFWGTPMPIWVSEDMEEIVVIGSIAELEQYAGRKLDDIHRHFIDDITIPSKRGPEFGVLKRVEDVFDCWFESGSMPYAQQHYPFENKEYFEENFPAQFIAEGLDQTRGWFYTLMILSTALFDKPPFQNLICNGLVLASDGKKMSKRLKNYPDPNQIVDKYGADALRLYLINSPVVRAETLRFKEEGVLSVVKDVFLPWYNAYRFFVQNSLALEAESGGPFVPSPLDEILRVDNVLDRWVLTASNSLCKFVKQEMDAYRLYTVVPKLVSFIENLTNIYVRFNRKRIKGLKGPEDCKASLGALYHVLYSLCKLMAPFTPFFVENMYRNLRCAAEQDAPESVHFCDLPSSVEETEEDRKLQQSISTMMTIIEFGRNLREKHKRPVRTPLKEMIIVHPDAAFLRDIEGVLANYVLEELNIRQLTVCADQLKYSCLRAEPDWKALGKKLGKKMGPVGAAVKKMSSDDVQELAAKGKIVLAGEELSSDVIKVLRDFKLPEGVSESEMDANSDGDLLVLVDLREDDALVAAGLAREFVNRVQKLRKKAGLEPKDEIEIFFSPSKEAMDLVDILKHEALVAETLRRAPVHMSKDDIPDHLVVVGSEQCGLTNGYSFSLTIALSGILPQRAAISECVGGDEEATATLCMWLKGLNIGALGDDTVETPRVKGHTYSLKRGKHFSFSFAEHENGSN